MLIITFSFFSLPFLSWFLTVWVNKKCLWQPVTTTTNRFNYLQLSAYCHQVNMCTSFEGSPTWRALLEHLCSLVFPFASSYNTYMSFFKANIITVINKSFFFFLCVHVRICQGVNSCYLEVLEFAQKWVCVCLLDSQTTFVSQWGKDCAGSPTQGIHSVNSLGLTPRHSTAVSH